ncbi:MAG: hypothetical protein ACF8Q5_09180 [Phycisphaerales bacterium JB040]
MKQYAFAGLAAMGAFGLSASGQNIILNSGFEAGTGGDADNWAELGGPSGSTTRDGSMPDAGNFAALMQFDHINNPAAGAAYFIEQVQGVGSIDNAVNYDLSFRAKVASTDFTGMNAFVQILWLDQDGSDGGGVRGEMLTSLISLGINDSYQTFSFNDMDAADGADSFLLRFQIAAGAVADVANGLYVDNVSLSQVPTPASAALLGLGGLMATRRRR